MFDFIPINSYIPIYFNFILFVVLFSFLHFQQLEMDDPRNIMFLRAGGVALFVSLLLYIGFRPLNGIFVDMTTYAYMFNRWKEGKPTIANGDTGFFLFLEFCAKNLDIVFFFFLSALVYVGCIAIASIKFFGRYWYYSFIMIVSAFTFWAYGTNVIRCGMASSIFLLAVSFHRKKFIMIALLILSLSFHKSMTLPIFAFALANFYSNPRYFLGFWFLSIAMSIAFGGFWELFFAGLGFGDDRTSYLTNHDNAAEFSRTGFRWDFLLYSGTAVFSGWYFIFKKNFNDKFYHQIYCTFLLANAFWILVIRANFSDRFAYLSWFLLGFVIIYPLLKERMLARQNLVIGSILVSFYLFTYFFLYILAK